MYVLFMWLETGPNRMQKRLIRNYQFYDHYNELHAKKVGIALLHKLL